MAETSENRAKATGSSDLGAGLLMRAGTRGIERATGSVHRAQRLLDAGLVGILYWTIDGGIVDANDTFLQMLGYTREDLEAGCIDWIKITPPELRERDEQPVADLYTTGRHLPFEKKYVRKDGTHIPVLVASAFEEGSRTEGVGFVVDISPQKRAEWEAMRSRQEVETIFESMTDAFYALDTEWRFTHLNAEAERLLRRRREELIGRVVWDEFPEAASARFGGEYRRAVREGVAVAIEEFYSPLDTWFEIRAFPTRGGAGGGTPARLSVYFRNVTERKLAEQERERLLAEQSRLLAELEAANARQREWLHQSEERFHLLVEGVQDYAIFGLDPAGHVTSWNAGAERFKGYKPEEIIGQHFSRFYTEEDVAARHPWHELEIATREGRYEEEGWRIRKDGTRFWASVAITALRDEKGDLRGFSKVTRDITERRQRERERAVAEAQEQQRRFLKDILLSVTEGKLVLCDGPSELPAPPSLQPAGDPIPLTKETLKAVRTRVAEVSASCVMPKDGVQDLVTAASECAMNAVQHAGGGTAWVYGDVEDGRVQVWIQDQGAGIDLSNLPRATLEPGFSTGGVGIGHGFSLMIACCQRIHLLTGGSGTTVVLTMDRTPPEPAWLRSFD